MLAEFTSNRGSPTRSKIGYLIVGVYNKKDFTPAATNADKKFGRIIQSALSNSDLGDKPGNCFLVPVNSRSNTKRIIIVQLGKRSEFSSDRFLKVVHSIAQYMAKLPVDSAAFCIDDLAVEGRDLVWQARHVVEAFNFHFYKFTQLKSNSKKRKKKWRIQFITEGSASLKLIRDGVRIGTAIGNGVRLARELGNLPGNICTPSYLANKARELSELDNVEVQVLEEEEMNELGMGSLLSVSRGSREPAKLIIIQYRGGTSRMRPVALVGKGLTFDAGGISIKPAAAMDEMKFDMCGGAAVIGTLSTAAQLKLPINIVGVVPSSENLPDGAANKPGDIVTSMSGTTIEILNTDAEGRLILCDALTYVGKFDPETVIDVATLTGACVIALGKHPSGLFSNDDQLAEDLVNAGALSHDRVWRMPIWDDYNKQLNSNFADLANVGGRDAGAVTAACFLAHFTKKYRWAHLDIAGTAWKSGNEKGATGRPVSMFVQYLLNYSQNTSI